MIGSTNESSYEQSNEGTIGPVNNKSDKGTIALEANDPTSERSIGRGNVQSKESKKRKRANEYNGR